MPRFNKQARPNKCSRVDSMAMGGFGFRASDHVGSDVTDHPASPNDIPPTIIVPLGIVGRTRELL